MKVYTFNIARDGEFVERIGVSASDLDNAHRILVKAGYDMVNEDVTLVSTQ